MERHLKNICVRTIEDTKNVLINADREPEKAREFFKKCIEHDKNADAINLLFIKNFEKDLEMYDHMLLNEVNTLFEARKLERLITGRLKVLTKSLPDKKDDDFENFEKVISYGNLLQEELDCKIFELKNLSNQPELKKFKTKLDDTERLELCDKLISESLSDMPKYDKIFIGKIDKPTLLYLLGGKRPEKIKKIQMAGRHQNVYNLLLEISAHKFKDKIYIPNFVKHKICPEVLLNKTGDPILRLNERVY